jgi:probable HAF family extracellular repeat protein
MNMAGKSLFWCCVLLCLVPLAAGQQYGVIDLGSLAPGGVVDVSYAGGINSSGQVVGSSYTPAILLHAYVWTAQQGIKDLGTFGGNSSSAYAINDFGTVVGQADLPSGLFHAFSWTESGGMQDLGTLGGSESAAYAINNRGEIVGSAFTTGGLSHAFLWTKAGGMQDLGTLGGDGSTAYAINSNGEVVGTSQLPNNSGYHAFLWSQAKGMQDLGTINNFNDSSAYGINDSSKVVGYVGGTQAFTYTFGFLWSSGHHLNSLGFLEGGIQTFPVGINSFGQVVGSFADANSVSYAFLWTKPTGMSDLNTMIPPNSGWILGQASAINKGGQIAGSGPVLIGGNYTNHAFLLTP